MTPPKKKNRAALYTRVSTSDKGQEVENQFIALREFCEREGYEIVVEYADRKTGTKGRGVRSEFDELFKAAEKREFDLVVFWSLDRFSREGITKTVSYLQLLSAYNVGFVSYQEPMLNTDNELISHIVVGVISYFAQFEIKRKSERVKAGQKRAREQGRVIGRPDKFSQHRKHIEKLLIQGKGKKAIARETGLAYNTAKKFIGKIDEESRGQDR